LRTELIDPENLNDLVSLIDLRAFGKAKLVTAWVLLNKF